MLTALVVLALVVAVLGLVTGFLALRTLAKLRRSVGLLGRGPGGRRESVVETTARYVDLTEQTRREFDDLSVRVLAALSRYEAGVQTRAQEAEGVVAVQIDALRAELTAELDRLKDVVNRELVQIRDGIEEHKAAALADIADERARAASSDAAAKEQLMQAAKRVTTVVDTAMRRVALVRFDAFDDLSGRLSFSLALLDGRGDGIALTALTGRSDTRLYAKPVNAGHGATELSPEEEQAVNAAMRT